jgi:hypothetical protein
LSSKMKLLAVGLGIIVILTSIFTGIVLAADPTDNQNLPACCPQYQGLSSGPGCCIQQGNAVTNPYQGGRLGSCCGR